MTIESGAVSARGTELINFKLDGLLASEPVQVMGFESCPDYQAQLVHTRTALANGELPEIGYLTLIVDQDGSKSNFIPADRYAGHFAAGHAPIAPIGHGMHEHDSEHVLGYRASFESELFSLVVIGAAQSSLRIGRPELFTDAMDTLGDNTLDIIGGLANDETFHEAKVNLSELAALYTGNAAGDPLTDMLHARLCYELGFSQSSTLAR